MFDPIAPSLAAVGACVAPGSPGAPPPNWFARMLDEIDYGMLLVADDRVVLHANQAARAELDAEHPLQLLGAELRVRHPRDLTPLREALVNARARGLRKLMCLGERADKVSVAVVPLPAVGDGDAMVLLVLGKRRMCEALSAHAFASAHGLTPAESRVLSGLCEGRSPAEIARLQGVAISTVRTQIGTIRAKTGAPSIRALARQVAVLPPLVGALRGVPC